MKKILGIIGTIAFIVMATMPVSAASVVTNARWHGDVRVTNSGLTTKTNVSTNMSLDSANFTGNGYSTSNFSDMALLISGTDTAFMPSYNGSSFILFVPQIAGAQNIDYDLYSGNVTGGKLAYFPDTAGATVNDTAPLEHGANFTDEVGVFLNSTGDIINKTNGINYHYDLPTTNVTLTIPSVTGATSTIRPDGAGDLTNVTTLTGAPTHWQAESDSNLATSISTKSDAYQQDLYSLGNFSASGNFTITSVVVHIQISTDDNTVSRANAQPLWKIGGVVYTGSEFTCVTADGVVEKTQTYNTSPATGLAWTASEINGAQIGVGLKETEGANVNTIICYEEWAVVTYNVAGVSVTKTSVPVGYHVVTGQSDSTNLWLTVDSSSSSNVTTTPVPDNANAYTIGSSATPYIEYAKMYVEGNLKGSWTWQYANTFTDLSGNGNTMYPSFRTSSSDSSISAALVSFVPVNQAQASGTVLTNIQDVLPNTPILISQLYTEGNFSKIPAADSINELLNDSQIPWELFWFPFIFIGIVIVGFTIYWLTTVSARGGIVSVESVQEGSLLLMVVVMEFLLAALGIMNPIPFWPTILFPIPGAAIVISKKHYSF